MSSKLGLRDAQELQLAKQHYHELIEAKNREFRENEKQQEHLRKELNVDLR